MNAVAALLVAPAALAPALLVAPAALAPALLVVAASLAPAVPEPIAVQLREKLELSAQDLERARSGVVVKELAAESGSRQLSVAAVAWIDAPPRRLTRQLWDQRGIPDNGEIAQSGVFSVPAVAADLASFRMPESDLEVLRSCRVGSCKLKIDEAAIEAFGAVSWSSPDATVRAESVARETLLRYARSYQREGSRGLPVYADKSERSSVAQGFGGLLAHADRLRRYVADLDLHLQQFPDSGVPYTSDLLHWSVSDYGYRPVTQLTHAVLYEPPDSPFSLLVQKYILLTHYFVTRLELVWMLPDALDVASRGTWLVYVDRSLFDGDVGGLQRMMLVRGVLADVKERIGALRSLVGR